MIGQAEKRGDVSEILIPQKLIGPGSSAAPDFWCCLVAPSLSCFYSFYHLFVLS